MSSPTPLRPLSRRSFLNNYWHLLLDGLNQRLLNNLSDLDDAFMDDRHFNDALHLLGNLLNDLDNAVDNLFDLLDNMLWNDLLDNGLNGVGLLNN